MLFFSFLPQDSISMLLRYFKWKSKSFHSGPFNFVFSKVFSSKHFTTPNLFLFFCLSVESAFCSLIWRRVNIKGNNFSTLFFHCCFSLTQVRYKFESNKGLNFNWYIWIEGETFAKLYSFLKVTGFEPLLWTVLSRLYWRNSLNCIVK